VLAYYADAGVRVLSSPNLHANVIATDRRAVIGSANASHGSTLPSARRMGSGPDPECGRVETAASEVAAYTRHVPGAAGRSKAGRQADPSLTDGMRIRQDEVVTSP